VQKYDGSTAPKRRVYPDWITPRRSADGSGCNVARQPQIGCGHEEWKYVSGEPVTVLDVGDVRVLIVVENDTNQGVAWLANDGEAFDFAIGEPDFDLIMGRGGDNWCRRDLN